ncbi:MAG: RNase adapter RapZ, partial [Alphaproteobacteria bacterium]|nr:RNase adapter RapZ [Alphaproteobacteria bacterium]
MSGAGKSTALKLLEDIGYEVVDNLPLSLLSNLVRPMDSGLSEATVISANRPLALCVDVRTRQFDLEHFEHDIAPLLDRTDLDVTLLFLDGDRFFARTIPIAGYSITQQIAKEFAISPEEAEILKRRHGFVALG